MKSDSGWMGLAERSANERGQRILEAIERAVLEHAPEAVVEPDARSLRIRGRAMVRKWISEPGLRFARRIGQ